MHITQHISGIGDRPEVVAQKAQTRIGELWSYRAHDLEPELT